MQRVGPLRIFNVVTSDFPITIRAAAKDMAIYQGVFSSVLVTRDGETVATFSIEESQPSSDPLVRQVIIPNPVDTTTASNARYTAPANIHITFQGFFATANGTRPRYELTLAGGEDTIDTTVKQPSVDPQQAPLTFQWPS